MSNFKLPVGLVNAAIFTTPHATPDLDPQQALLRLILSAKKDILFSMYGWTLAALSEAMILMHGKGIVIRGVADRSSYYAHNAQYPAMVAAGVDIRLWGGKWVLAHEKVLIVDGKTVSLGSYNMTNAAEKVNREVLMICKGAQVSRILAPVLTEQIQATYAAGKAP